jgi:hypothetical protein
MKQHLTQVLGIVSAINGNGSPVSSEVICQRFALADRPDVRKTVAYALTKGLIESDAANHARFWITDKGGDVLDAGRETPVPPEALVEFSEDRP